MTIETQASKVRYVGDGTAVVFPVPFPVRQAEHLRLYLASSLDRDIEFETEYSVDGIGSEEVSVILSTPLPSGENLAIVRLVPLTQQMDLENGGNFDAETIERQFDITEMQIQQIQEQVDRTIKVPVTSGISPDEFWKELLDVSKAALEVYRRMLELADAQVLGAHAVNARRSSVVTEAVPAGGILTLPAWYYPKRNILYLAVDGMVCAPRLPDNADQSERQYEEVGDDPNTLSNQVRVHFPLEAGMLVDAWVVASNQSGDEAAQSAEAAAASAALARQWATNPEGVPVAGAEFSAFHWARKAEAAAAAGGAYGEASPANQGLAPAGGQAGQVYRVNSAGNAYGWEALTNASPARPGLAPSGGAAGQVYKVNAAGTAYEWSEFPASGHGLLDLKPSLTGIIDPGFLSVCADNGLLSRSAFPEAWAKIQEVAALNLGNVVSDAVWQAEKTAQNGVCAKFSLGDGSTTFRIPLVPAVYLRGKGGVSGLTVGGWLRDQVGPLEASMATTQMAGGVTGIEGMGGTLYPTSGLVGFGNRAGENVYRSAPNGDSNPIVRGLSWGSETRPVTVVCDYQMKMYGAMSDAGTVSLAQMITAMAGKLDTSRYDADAWMRVAASASIQANGTLSSGVNITSVTKVATGVDKINSAAITPACQIIASGKVAGAGFIACERSDATYARSAGQCHIVVMVQSGGSADGPFDLVIYP